MFKQIAVLVLILIACSAPTEIQAEPAPVPLHGRALSDVEFLQLVNSAAVAMSMTQDSAGECLGLVEGRPEACARKAVRYADALAIELRRSDNWPE